MGIELEFLSGRRKWAVAIHGGAGVITRQALSPDLQRAHEAALQVAVEAASKVLRSGGSAMDAVVSAVMVLEDEPLFNAGKGAVLTRDGRHELDAAVMCGATGLAGAVAGVTTPRNPVQAARAVMDRSGHVLLCGAGADAFIAQAGLETVPPDHYRTERRVQQWQQALRDEQVLLDHSTWPADGKFGTVGAVACDEQGHVAAATSTGGMTGKLPGRVGDSPLIGAGTYAQDSSLAWSGTGQGEFFMRAVLAKDAAARMLWGQMPLAQAIHSALDDGLERAGGTGGAVTCDAQGQIVCAFNCEGMYRAWQRADEPLQVRVFRGNEQGLPAGPL